MSQLQELEERLAQRRVRTLEELSELLADGFREHGASGRTYDRQEAIRSYDLDQPWDVRITNFVTVPVREGVALVTYRSHEPGGRRAHRSSLWVRSGDRWQMLFHQGTVCAREA